MINECSRFRLAPDIPASSGRFPCSATPRAVSLHPRRLEGLCPGSQIELLRPGAAVLVVQLPIGVGDRVDAEQSVWSPLIPQLGQAAEQARPADPSVNDDVRDVNPLGP